ncbi:hypothetical protein [Nonomuraea sp. SBT364]|uniref:hypothetical protein n=1 Tax=Nonomuraea sp. SBT364 TaxID=1580530 RepID=UPI00066C91EB|nr:hypothetical protein [Nonomuraea sp. SBT364]
MTTENHLYQGEYPPSLLAEIRAEGRAIALAKGMPESSAEHVAEGFVRGYVRGLTRALLLLLDARGFSSPEQAGERIRNCADLSTLTTWIGRAAVIDPIDDVFS